MEEGIVCPKCHRRNEIQKFCIFCGHKLLDEDEIRLIHDNPNPYCLNCGRTVMKSQSVCECGYELTYVNCHVCSSKNAYTNRFCTECGKKLWTSNVSHVNYAKITPHFIRDKFPQEMRNTILHLRYKQRLEINFPDDIHKIGENDKTLQSNKTRVDNQLSEILSRWKIVSPHYCINCLSIMKADEYRCQKCKTVLPYAEKRVNQVKNKKYKKPVFDMVELKWNSKFSENYLDSLAPDIGESQFDYRERLKWEFTETNDLKRWITNALNREINRKKEEDKRRRRSMEFQKQEKERKRQLAERRKQEEEYIRLHGGGYCSLSCRYCSEAIIDSHGAESADYSSDMSGTSYRCSLGYSVDIGSFCKHYR